MATQILASADSEEEPLAKRRRVSDSPIVDIIARVDEDINPMLEDVLLRGSALRESAVKAMGAVNRGLLREAAGSWSRFKKTDRETLRSSPVVRRLQTLVLELVVQARDTPDRQAGEVGPIVNFYFDIVSLTMKQEIHPEVAALMALIAKRGDILYRQPYLGELREPLVVPTDFSSPGWMVNVSSVIEDLRKLLALPVRELQTRRLLQISVLRDFFLLYHRPRDQTASAWSLLMDQVEEALCKKPVLVYAVVRKVAACHFAKLADRMKMVTFLARLMRHCRDLTTGGSVFEASSWLRRDQFDITSGTPPLVFPDLRTASDADMSEFLLQEPLRYLGEVIATATQAETLVEMLRPRSIVEVVDWGHNDLRNLVRDASPEGLRAMGRAVALALRAGGHLGNLEFSITLLKALHSDELPGGSSGGSRSEESPVASSFSNQVLEAMHHFVKGTVDALGVLGLRVFPWAELVERFAPVEDPDLWFVPNVPSVAMPDPATASFAEIIQFLYQRSTTVWMWVGMSVSQAEGLLNRFLADPPSFRDGPDWGKDDLNDFAPDLSRNGLRALGRAVALVLRAGGDLGCLTISTRLLRGFEAVARGYWPSSDFSPASEQRMRFFTEGTVDVLGVGGISGFSWEELSNRFRPVDPPAPAAG